ncbi:hypothetical protein BTJ40_09000 [Microbulbifer sp. A4B17]|nr:hypothetical protein BTJ40_09000 [Microbulbifer sp. A4B17]
MFALLVVSWLLVPTWFSGILSIITESYPEGNPDNINYSDFMIPIAIVFLGTIGMWGLFNFLSGAELEDSITWRSNAAFVVVFLSGFTASAYVALKGLPGFLGNVEYIFTFFIPVGFSIYFSWLRFYTGRGDS